MKQLRLISITTSLLITSLIACQKKDTTVATPDEVEVNITSPTEGSSYKTGDTVSIVANISSKTQLHGYIVRIKEIGTENVIFETEGHTHDGSLTVNEQWINTLNYATDLQLDLITVIDHNENTKNANVGFKSQP